MTKSNSTDFLISKIKNTKGYRNQIKHIERIPFRTAQFVEDLSELKFHPKILKYLSDNSIKLYKHQFEAIKVLKTRKNMMITSATSSGKTLIYLLTILDEILKDPTSTAILLFPRKALSRDQLEKFTQVCEAIGLSKSLIGVYDGDTLKENKDMILDRSNIIITNPYGFHLYLKYHFRWGKIFRNLKYFIIDEVHMYRGIFGTNIAFLLRRFNRILDTYNMDYTYGLFSATIGNPLELSQKLTDRAVQLVNIDTSGQRGKDLIIWEPPFIEQGDFFLGLKSQAVFLFKQLIPENIQSLMFLQLRIETELFAIKIRDAISEDYPQLSKTIMSYQAGISAQDRRQIEKDIRERKLLGIMSTNALELGIDIGDLDAAVLGGFPGSVNSFWQQAGRAGRTSFDLPPDQQANALIFYIPKVSPLDMYYAKHFDELMDLNHEDAVIDLDNVLIAKNHLWCAVHEKHVSDADIQHFGINAEKAIEMLERESKIRKVGSKYRPVNQKEFVAGKVSLDMFGEEQYLIVVVEPNGSRKNLTVEDDLRVKREIYPNTVYLYKTETYLVLKVDHEKKIIEVEKDDLTYYTVVKMLKVIEIVSEQERKEVNDFTFHYGNVNVFFTPGLILKRDFESDNLIGDVEIVNPQTFCLETKAIWWTLPEDYAYLALKSDNALRMYKTLEDNKQNEIEINQFIADNGIREPIDKALMSEQFAGGIHAMEHACIAMVPYFQLCDRNDIGGVSIPRHDDTNLPTVFIYDGYQGGIGITQRVFRKVEDLFDKTEKMIKSCKCSNGCPACVLSPKCGNDNIPIDKHAALVLLKSLNFKKKVP